MDASQCWIALKGLEKVQGGRHSTGEIVIVGFVLLCSQVRLQVCGRLEVNGWFVESALRPSCAELVNFRIAPVCKDSPMGT